jgi:hypothetical protein
MWTALSHPRVSGSVRAEVRAQERRGTLSQPSFFCDQASRSNMNGSLHSHAPGACEVETRPRGAAWEPNQTLLVRGLIGAHRHRHARRRRAPGRGRTLWSDRALGEPAYSRTWTVSRSSRLWFRISPAAIWFQCPLCPTTVPGSLQKFRMANCSGVRGPFQAALRFLRRSEYEKSGAEAV